MLYFADKILAIDPANAIAADVKAKLAESVRQNADLAYAREDWLSAEKEYKNLALIYPNDISINERLADISAKIDASVKDREQADRGLENQGGSGPEGGRAAAPGQRQRLGCAAQHPAPGQEERLRARRHGAAEGDAAEPRATRSSAAAIFQGARSDFRLVLQYFPDDKYSSSRLVVR